MSLKAFSFVIFHKVIILHFSNENSKRNFSKKTIVYKKLLLL